MSEIIETGFYVTTKSDESVGIFSTEYKITNPHGFHFESEEDLQQFKNELQSTFELIEDCPVVQSFSERIKELKHEEELLEGQPIEEDMEAGKETLDYFMNGKT